LVCKTSGDTPFTRPHEADRGVLCLVAAYTVIASLWVILSDWLLTLVIESPFQFSPGHVVKDLVYIVVTATLLYLLLTRLANAEAARNRNVERIIEQTKDGVVLCDQSLHIVYTNPATQKICGYSAEELVGHPIAEFLSEQYVAQLDAHSEALATQASIRREWDIQHKEGWHVHLEVTTQRLPDGTYLAIGSDLTETRRAQKNTDIERQRFKALVNSIPDAVWLKDTAGTYISCNPALAKIFNLPIEKILNRTDRDIRPTGEFDEFMETDAKVLATGVGLTYRKKLLQADGTQVELEATKKPVFDLNGALIGVVGIAHDITERQMAEDRLRASEEFNRAVLDASATQMAVVDKSGKVVAVNDAWIQFARENSDFAATGSKTGVGSNFFEICQLREGPENEQAKAALAGVQAVLNGETARFSMESACVIPSCELWFMMNATPLKLGAGGAVIAYVDITSVKDAQKLQARFSRQLQALARMHQDIQEKERHHLSMELHDQIGQSLAALKIMLASAKLNLDDHQSSGATLDVAQEIVDDIANTTRDIARRLRPPLLDELGLKPALGWHISNLALPPTVNLRFEENIETQRFSEALELASFRIIQEAITNALRHAEATEVVVRINYTGDRLCLSVQDDGKGFEPNVSLEKGDEQISLGLIGIRERVTSLGGEYVIDSQPNQGTRVSACLPTTA